MNLKRYCLISINLLLIVVIFGSENLADGNRYIPYCAFFDSDKYHGKTISSRALLYAPRTSGPEVDGGEMFFYSESCNNRDYFALANLESVKFVQGAIGTPPEPNHRLYEVEFEAVFSISLLPSFGHLDSFRANFDVTSVKSIKEISNKIASPKLSQSAPIVETSSLLNSLNNELMFSVLNSGSGLTRLDDLVSSNTRFLFNGKYVAKRDFIRLITIDRPIDLSYKVAHITRKERVWKIQGHVIGRFSENASTRLTFDNTFVPDNDNNWKAKELRVSRFR